MFEGIHTVQKYPEASAPRDAKHPSKETMDTLNAPTAFLFNENSKTADLPDSNTNSLFKNMHGETLLTYLFFSRQNVQSLQNVVRQVVFREIKQVIDEQSASELLIIMRATYLEHSRHPALLSPEQSENVRRKIIEQTVAEVKRLNELVVNDVVPRVISNVLQYLKYLEDASTPRKDLPPPTSTNIKGERKYRSATSVLLGGTF